jgi:hypothetical protein
LERQKEQDCEKSNKEKRKSDVFKQPKFVSHRADSRSDKTHPRLVLAFASGACGDGPISARGNILGHTDNFISQSSHREILLSSLHIPSTRQLQSNPRHKMPPKTKKTTPAQENVSLGPLAGDGTIFIDLNTQLDHPR